MNMAKSAKLRSTAERRGRPRKRAEQQRSLETRGAILDAAIAEFAERGFEGASIRAIADRLGLQHPLITYHYRSKDILWRAAAEHAFAQIRAGWDTSAPENSICLRLLDCGGVCYALPLHRRISRISSVHAAGGLYQQSAAEVGCGNGIGAAPWTIDPPDCCGSKQGLLPAVDPILFHYMMVSLTATLSGFGPEMQVTGGVSAENAKVIEAYWRLVDETVFGKHARGKPARVNEASKR